MSYKIVVDSCGELTEEMVASGRFESAPLGIEVNGVHLIDDATFDQAKFLKMVKESPVAPKSSCPSPERYMKAYHCEAEHVYAVTLSAALSGSYNSAILGKNLYEEEYGKKPIHVVDSCSASVGETLLAMKIQECEEMGMTFEDTVKAVENYKDSQRTYFVLETLETLRKNGRISGVKAMVASTLNIKPVMASTNEGEIVQLGQARGMKKALIKMVDHIIKEVKKSEEKVLAISHCNCPERAKQVQEMIQEKIKVKSSIIMDTAGISSTYANDGGIIVVI